jgi:hypothetical protein
LTAFLIGIVSVALTACASGEQKAEDQAVTGMTGQLSELKDSAKSFLRSSSNRDSARRVFALERGSNVYASSMDGDAITWSIALLGQGGHTTSGTSTVIRLRTCLQLRSAAALELSLTTVKCPAQLKTSPYFASYERDIDLLALGKYDDVPKTPAPEGPSDRSHCLSGSPEGCVGG